MTKWNKSTSLFVKVWVRNRTALPTPLVGKFLWKKVYSIYRAALQIPITLMDPDPPFLFDAVLYSTFRSYAYPDPDPPPYQSHVNQRPLVYILSTAIFWASTPSLWVFTEPVVQFWAYTASDIWLWCGSGLAFGFDADPDPEKLCGAEHKCFLHRVGIFKRKVCQNSIGKKWFVQFWPT